MRFKCRLDYHDGFVVGHQDVVGLFYGEAGPVSRMVFICKHCNKKYYKSYIASLPYKILYDEKLGWKPSLDTILSSSNIKMRTVKLNKIKNGNH